MKPITARRRCALLSAACSKGTRLWAFSGSGGLARRVPPALGLAHTLRRAAGPAGEVEASWTTCRNSGDSGRGSGRGKRGRDPTDSPSRAIGLSGDVSPLPAGNRAHPFASDRVPRCSAGRRRYKRHPVFYLLRFGPGVILARHEYAQELRRRVRSGSAAGVWAGCRRRTTHHRPEYTPGSGVSRKVRWKRAG